jgi:hypothetical protein
MYISCYYADDINDIPDFFPGMRLYVASLHEIEDESQVKKPNPKGEGAGGSSPELLAAPITLFSGKVVRGIRDLLDTLIWSRLQHELRCNITGWILPGRIKDKELRTYLKPGLVLRSNPPRYHQARWWANQSYWHLSSSWERMAPCRCSQRAFKSKLANGVTPISITKLRGIKDSSTRKMMKKDSFIHAKKFMTTIITA